MFKKLLENFPFLEKDGSRTNVPGFYVASHKILEVCQFLKNSGFVYLVCISGLEKEKWLEVVYHIGKFQGRSQKDFLCLKVRLPKAKPELPSLTSLWKGADWYEREIYDMFGINFIGHPNLKRIFMPENYKYFPFRKDFEYKDKVRYATLPIQATKV